MDLLSMTASIGSICGFTVKLIFSISEFIDSAQQAPTEVQSLSNELAALYAGFGHIRVAVKAPRVFELPDMWKDNFDGLMTDCETTLKEVQDLIDKAKITKPSGSATLAWKSIKFVFKAKQVEFLRCRIVLQNGILQNLLAALAETRGNHIEQLLEDIHNKVKELVSTQSKVREVLVVLEKEGETAKDADYILSDRRKSPNSARNDVGNIEQTDYFSSNRTENQKLQRKGVDNGERDKYDNSSGTPSISAPVGEPTLTQLMSKVSQMNSALESLTRRFPLEENLDIVQNVIAATWPSIDVQRALNIINTKTWTLLEFRERAVGQATWSANLRADPTFKDRQLLRCKLFIQSDEETLGFKFLPDKDDSVDFVIYRGWRDSETTLRDCTVTTHVPLYPEDNQQEYWRRDDEFTFHTVQDAQDFQFCFTHLCSMLQLIRKVQIAACSHINPHIRFTTSAEIEKAAYWFGHNRKEAVPRRSD